MDALQKYQQMSRGKHIFMFALHLMVKGAGPQCDVCLWPGVGLVRHVTNTVLQSAGHQLWAPAGMGKRGHLSPLEM